MCKSFTDDNQTQISWFRVDGDGIVLNNPVQPIFLGFLMKIKAWEIEGEKLDMAGMKDDIYFYSLKEKISSEGTFTCNLTAE